MASVIKDLAVGLGALMVVFGVFLVCAGLVGWAVYGLLGEHITGDYLTDGAALLLILMAVVIFGVLIYVIGGALMGDV